MEIGVRCRDDIGGRNWFDSIRNESERESKYLTRALYACPALMG